MKQKPADEVPIVARRKNRPSPLRDALIKVLPTLPNGFTARQAFEAVSKIYHSNGGSFQPTSLYNQLTWICASGRLSCRINRVRTSARQSYRQIQYYHQDAQPATAPVQAINKT